MDQIRAILFDIGGVILRHPKSPSVEVLSRVFKKTVKEVTPYYEKEKKKYFSGEINTEDFFQLCIFEFKSDLDVTDVISKWDQEYTKLRLVDLKMLEIIDALKGKVIRCVFSNTLPINYMVNRKAGVFDSFDEEYFSFQIGWAKPDPEMYLYAMKDMKLAPGEILLVDDRENNLAPARTLGMQTFHFDILVHYPKVLRNYFEMKGLLP